MNDFTKKELEILRGFLEPRPNENHNLEIYDLLNKLHFMIDNYCEHEWDLMIYNKQPGNFKCKNCGIFLND